MAVRDLTFLENASERVREIFRYWDAKRGARRMPAREDFDPADLVGHLPGLLLVDVEGVGPDGVGIYRYRVVGTAEVTSRGHDPTGRLVVDGYFDASLDAALASYETVRRSGGFLYQPVSFVTDNHRPIEEDSILLPFSEDGEQVSQILVYSERRERASDPDQPDGGG